LKASESRRESQVGNSRVVFSGGRTARRGDRTRRRRRAEQAVQAAGQRWRDRLRTALHETGRQYPACQCDFTDVHDDVALLAMGDGCTAMRAREGACRRLDAVRRRMGL